MGERERRFDEAQKRTKRQATKRTAREMADTTIAPRASDVARIAELEAALHRCNDVATAEGNDPRNAPDTRSGFRAMGAVIRREMAALGL